MSRATTTAARKSHRNDATIAMESQKKIAVLDDYQGFSKPAFDELAPQYEVSYFPHTLLPYNHPDTPQAVKDELARRLEPFHIISTPWPLTFLLPLLVLLLFIFLPFFLLLHFIHRPPPPPRFLFLLFPV